MDRKAVETKTNRLRHFPHSSPKQNATISLIKIIGIVFIREMDFVKPMTFELNASNHPQHISRLDFCFD